MNDYILVLFLALACAGVYAAYRFGRLIETIITRLKELEEINERKRHTHSTQAALEDSLFTISRLLMERDQEDLWLVGVRDALAKILQDPNGYPKE